MIEGEYDEQAKRIIKALSEDFKRFEGTKNTPATFNAMCQSMNVIVDCISMEYPPQWFPKWGFQYENDEYTGRIKLHILHPVNGKWEHVIDPTFNVNDYQIAEQDVPMTVFSPFKAFEPIAMAWEPAVKSPTKDNRGNLK